MFYYTPKLHHAIIAAILCILCLLLSSKTQGKAALAFNLGALMFGFLFIVVVVLLVLEGLNERVRVMIEFARAIAQLDDEARAMMAFEFPHMQYRMKHGEVRAYFEDTGVPIEMFRLFLQTSNDRYISPRRDWYTADQPEWAWLEIKDWLDAHDKIIPDSAAGSHSWLWKGNSYQHLSAYWMAGRKLVDMSNIVYEYDTPPPPPLKDARGG
jgi:hypothetical protein